jgi:hypothetical protein
LFMLKWNKSHTNHLQIFSSDLEVEASDSGINLLGFFRRNMMNTYTYTYDWRIADIGKSQRSTNRKD